MSSQTHAPLARVAVLLSGAYRTLTDCNDTIARHVIGANPWARFDVYAALTADAATEAERKRMEAAVRFSGACIAAVRIESNGAVSAAVHRDAPSIDALPMGVGTARGKAGNIVKMFRGIGRAWQLLEENVAEPGAGGNGTPPATPIEIATRRTRGYKHATAAAAAAAAARVSSSYELVLRVRPDLCFCAPLDLRPALAQPGNYWLPWAAPDAGLAFDQIAAGSAAMISLYASAYHASVIGEVNTDKRELYPEAVMWRHLERHGGAVSGRIARMGGFRASLARHRADGTPHYDDPFGKLKQDLLGPLNNPRLAGGLPAHYCQKHLHAGRKRYEAAVARREDDTCAGASCMAQKERKAARKARRQGGGGESPNEL